jgi:hypothetical protein
MSKPILTLALLVLGVLTACSVTFDAPHIVAGSGERASETRTVGSFSAIELAGSADVDVSFGETQSVVVETDDNLLELIETVVQGDTLFIRHKPNTSTTTRLGVHVTIVMASLESVTVAGSGNVTIEGLDEDRVTFNLPGSGMITARGTAKTVDATLSGSGNIQCGDLEAENADVHINGSGNVTVYASQSLTAAISGSGNVQYRGNPEDVDESVTGSGNITALP